MEQQHKFFANRRNRLIIAIILIIIAIFAVIGVVTYCKITDSGYVRGVDVSAYQGDIDWKALKNQDIQFAYIKATEGTDHIDSRFQENWDGAQNAGILTGAYHFMLFDQDGKSQAEHFIENVPKENNSLPPVIDLELYGEYLENPMDKGKVQAIVNDMILRLQEYYGVTPIIYTNYNTYNTYLSDAFAEIPIWICDISNQEPELEGGHEWKFWQYSQRGLLDGVSGGDERFIDLDLYNGTYLDFLKEFVI